jgi:hypothetical protein
VTHARHNDPEHVRPAHDALAVAALRAGERPAHTARRLIRQGYSARHTTQILQHAYAVLQAEQARTRRSIAPQVYHQVVALVRAGVTDSAIVDAVAARGVEREDAARLVAQARRHWQARVAARSRTLTLWLRAWCLLLGVATFIIGGLPLSNPARTQSAGPEHVTLNAVVLADELNVRSGPSRSYPVLFTLSSYQAVQVIARAPVTGRYKIRLRDQREGWIRSDSAAVWMQLDPDTIPTVVPLAD